MTEIMKLGNFIWGAINMQNSIFKQTNQSLMYSSGTTHRLSLCTFPLALFLHSYIRVHVWKLILISTNIAFAHFICLVNHQKANCMISHNAYIGNCYILNAYIGHCYINRKMEYEGEMYMLVYNG